MYGLKQSGYLSHKNHIVNIMYLKTENQHADIFTKQVITDSKKSIG